ncbi:MAG: hypothetical protein L0229_00865 [Blastocatellia bacterium]|nr:hypothetical protein [Blastocatellia bacterium]
MIPNIKLFLTGNSSSWSFAELQKAVGQEGFYQEIALNLTKSVITERSLNQIGDGLVAIAEQSYTFRRMDTVEQSSNSLLALPLPERYRNIGRYYQALCVKRHGRVDEAQMLLEGVAESAPLLYKAKAMMSMGTMFWRSGDCRSAWPLYSEALRAASDKSCHDPLTLLQTHRGIAVLKSIDGDHRGALADLESMFPLVHTVGKSHPHLYYDYLNSLAVELSEVGRIEEAQNASRIVLASPFAPAYPEWRETGEELALKSRSASRSLVAFTPESPGASNVISLPVSEREDETGPTRTRTYSFQQPAIVVDLQKWKAHKAKEPDEEPQKKVSPEEMSSRDMLLRILSLVSEKGLTGDQLREIMLAAESVVLKTKDKDR